VEGTSGCHEPSPFTGRWSRQPWRLPHAGKRYGSQEPKLRRRREGAPGLAEEGEATEVSEARSVAGTVGRKRPRSEPPRRKVRHEDSRQGSACQLRSAEASSSVVKHSVPRVINRTEPKTPWGVHAMKVAEEPRTHEVRVHVDRLGGRSWSDASCVLSSGRSQGLVESQGASQKEARSTT
jgi:hypothetical protein